MSGGLSEQNHFELSSPVGVISDTHGLLRDEALALMRGCGLILHLGDVGDERILERLAELAPLIAIRGNIDRDSWCEALPLRRDITINGWRFQLVHDRADVEATAAFDAFLFGHSHKPLCQWHEKKEGGRQLWFNPGAAGRRRFRLPITAARLLARPERLCCATVYLLDDAPR
ncbi:metallophosphoesterase family protein [Kushneria aurantia]|uniref:Metallophosphoesterase family protein n=1 Tax=Kushneria aurantia TaxID=504092 RepID=A0ABV6G2I5_9GAMM|nr:metallophosphoesterase family protein [Kushneria aurantia]